MKSHKQEYHKLVLLLSSLCHYPQYVIVRYVHCNQANDGRPKQFPLNALLIAILFLPCMLLSNHLTRRLWVYGISCVFSWKIQKLYRTVFLPFNLFLHISQKNKHKFSIVIAFNSKITNESSIDPIIDWVPFYKHRLIKIISWISNCVHRFIWGVIQATLS